MDSELLAKRVFQAFGDGSMAVITGERHSGGLETPASSLKKMENPMFQCDVVHNRL